MLIASLLVRRRLRRRVDVVPAALGQQESTLTPPDRRWLLGAVALESSSRVPLGGINFIVTAMNARAPGMKAFATARSCYGRKVIANILFAAPSGPLVAGA